ncbi:hypothetical protein BH23VER1_BH23VER1_28490 [soil metagenome]
MDQQRQNACRNVQAIWSFHTLTRGWGDIGYNFLIDPDGVIYEGRAGGDSTIGAHFSCANSRTMGVCILGDFTAQEPTAAALESLAYLLAWKADRDGIDPLGNGYHPASQLVLNSICGHRDANASEAPGACPSGTVCPGAMLYPLLPSVRQAVANVIATGFPNPPQIEIRSLAFDESSGNGDGIPNPGEAYNVSVTLGHLDGPAATGITATLTSTGDYLEVTDGTKSYPDLPKGSSADEIGDFNFTISDQAPHGHQLTFLFEVAASEGTWAFPLSLPPVVAAPVVNLGGASFDPAAASPGDGITVSYQLTADRAFTATVGLTLTAPQGGTVPLSEFTAPIAAGFQTKNRAVPVPAGIPVGTYALVLTISEDGAVRASQLVPDALTVLPPPFADWAAIHIPDAALREAADDPDGDSLSNLVEYALVLDPATPDLATTEFLWVEDGGHRYPALRFRLRESPHLSAELEVFEESSGWVPGAVPAGSVAAAPGSSLRTLRSLVPADGTGRQLLRLRIGLAPEPEGE